MKWTRPLCGPASMSQNDFKTSETIQPQEASPVKHHMSVLGIDIAQRLFHVVGMNERGQIVLRKRLARKALRLCIATLPPVLSGMEACGGAHSWARRCRAHHHAVKRMAPQLVKPYRPTVSLDVISLVASSCGYYKGQIECRLAH